ncbi:MAG: hypothetical protein IJ457_04470 [Clostridia bacterium]|nr:hypothetical protein [Clostridia bacterium]
MFESICRKCFAFSISSYPTSFVKEVRIKKAFIGTQHAVPKEALPGFAAQGFPDGFYKSISVSFLKCGIGGARCTCISQNEAIAPRGVRASVAEMVPKAFVCGMATAILHSHVAFQQDPFSATSKMFRMFAFTLTYYFT